VNVQAVAAWVHLEHAEPGKLRRFPSFLPMRDRVLKLAPSFFRLLNV
jgi:hypothetical protein